MRNLRLIGPTRRRLRPPRFVRQDDPITTATALLARRSFWMDAAASVVLQHGEADILDCTCRQVRGVDRQLLGLADKLLERSDALFAVVAAVLIRVRDEHRVFTVEESATIATCNSGLTAIREKLAAIVKALEPSP